jgi:NADH-quinone oxidoreductase subunit N
MTDLILIVPELVLTGASLVLILLARRVRSPQLAAAWVVIAALGAIISACVSLGPSGTGFAGAIAGDGYARFFHVLFGAILALTALLSVKRLDSERLPSAEYYSLLLLASTGLMLAASAVDLLVLYLGLELTTLCAYALVGITRESSASNEAAVKYFLLGSFASAFLLYGIALVYGATGSTEFASIATAMSGQTPGGHPLLLIGMALVAVGLAFKIAAVPFHTWAPDAYQGAIAPVGAFLAAGSKGAGLAALGRVFLIAFAPERHVWADFLVGLAILSMVVGSLLAVTQSSMKRLLAYSSISHAGYALLGLIPGTPEGVSATMTYAFVYAFMTLGAFAVVTGLGQRGEDLEGYRGLAATSPKVAALMLLFLLSLTGIPLTAGFAGKFAVILSAVRAGYIAIAVVAVLCSVVSAFFYLRVAVLMYMTEPEGSAPARFPAAVSAALAVSAFVTVAGGILPGAFAIWTTPPQP